MVPSNVVRASHTIMESVNVRLKSNVCVDKCIIRIFLRLSVIFRFSFPETGPFREPLNYLNVGRDTNGNIIMYKCILNGFFSIWSRWTAWALHRGMTAFRRVEMFITRGAERVFFKIIYCFFLVANPKIFQENYSIYLIISPRSLDKKHSFNFGIAIYTYNIYVYTR